MNMFFNMFLPIKLSLMVRFLVGMLLFSRTLPRKEHYVIKVLAWSFLCLLISVFLPIVTEETIYVTTLFLIECLLSMFIVRICCKADWGIVFFISAAVFSAEHIASMLDSLIAMLNPELLSYSEHQTINIFILLSWFLSLALVYWLVYWGMFSGHKLSSEHNLNTNVMLQLLIVSILVNLYLNIYYTNLVSDRSLWISVFEYGLNIVISSFLLLMQNAVLKRSQTEKRLQMLSLLWDQAREQYRISKENVEAINIKCHDLKHMLLSLKDKTDEKEYTQMMELVDSYGAEIETNNEVLDVVFQEKNFQCRKLGIQFTCIIDGPALNFMDTTDLYVLFGNLIDNCIEAVSRLTETEVKNIQVTVRRDKGFVIVTTENGYTGELKWEDGRLSTSKDDHNNHGFGILSIEKIIHKYGGRYSISTEDHIFCMNIVFPVSMTK